MNVSRSSGAETAGLVIANHGVCNLFIPIQLLLYTPPMRFLISFLRQSFISFSSCPAVRFFPPHFFFSFYPPIKLDSLCRNGPLGQNLSSLRSASFPQLIFSSHLFLSFSVSAALMGNTYRRNKLTWTNVSFVLFVPKCPVKGSSVAECCGENEPERNDPTLAPSNLSQLILLVTTERPAPAGPSDSWLVIHDKCHIDTDITERERKHFPPPDHNKTKPIFLLFI